MRSTLTNVLAFVCPAALWGPALAQAAERKPNIVVIWGDDIGIHNISAYNLGVMGYKTPNIERLAKDGALFIDLYGQQSCTAGRANFITGEIPLRTGLTTVGQAGPSVGMADEAVTSAAVLKSMGYATSQLGKNRLGDLNRYLPTLHGFDEFHGYLYHLDVLSYPYWFSYPKDPAFRAKYGPRNVLHTYATDMDDPTEMPRWGKVGKQKIPEDGPLPPHPTDGVKVNMETVDDVFLVSSPDFMDKAKKDGKPFLVWDNTTRMHVFTFLSPKYRALMSGENNYGLEEAGKNQLDDIVGSIMQHLEGIGEADNTSITDKLLKSVKIGDLTYKNHLDGYNQMDLLLGKRPSKRHEIFYFGGAKLGAVRMDDMKFRFYEQPTGWPGPKFYADMPTIVNLRQYPFERLTAVNGETLLTGAPGYMMDFFARGFWRFVLVQDRVAELAKTAIDYPPMQDPASFNLDAVKQQIDDAIKKRQGQ